MWTGRVVINIELFHAPCLIFPLFNFIQMRITCTASNIKAHSNIHSPIKPPSPQPAQYRFRSHYRYPPFQRPHPSLFP